MAGLSVWANLALGLVQLLNWASNQITQSDWQNTGFMKAFMEYQQKVNDRVAAMHKVNTDNQNKSDEQLDKELME